MIIEPHDLFTVARRHLQEPVQPSAVSSAQHMHTNTRSCAGVHTTVYTSTSTEGRGCREVEGLGSAPRIPARSHAHVAGCSRAPVQAPERAWGAQEASIAVTAVTG